MRNYVRIPTVPVRARSEQFQDVLGPFPRGPFKTRYDSSKTEFCRWYIQKWSFSGQFTYRWLRLLILYTARLVADWFYLVFITNSVKEWNSKYTEKAAFEGEAAKWGLTRSERQVLTPESKFSANSTPDRITHTPGSVDCRRKSFDSKFLVENCFSRISPFATPKYHQNTTQWVSFWR